MKLRRSSKQDFDLAAFDGYEGEHVADGLQRDFREHYALSDLQAEAAISASEVEA